MGGAVLEVLRRVGDPGALGVLVLLAAGAVMCFQGSRMFRLSAGLAGLVLGLELVGQLAMHQGWGAAATVILAVLGGAALCAVFVIFPVLGVFGLGAMLAASLVSTAAAASGADLGPLWLVLTGLIGGFGALVLRRPVAVAATSLYCALAAMAGLFALCSGGKLGTAVRTMASPAEARNVPLFLLCVTVLVTGGIAVQFRYGGNAALGGGGKLR